MEGVPRPRRGELRLRGPQEEAMTTRPSQHFWPDAATLGDALSREVRSHTPFISVSESLRGSFQPGRRGGA